MHRSFGLVDYKAAEAEYFLLRILNRDSTFARLNNRYFNNNLNIDQSETSDTIDPVSSLAILFTYWAQKFI